MCRAFWRETVGFRLALYLDKKFPSWCWAEVCTVVGLGWGLFDRDKWDDIRSNGCAKDGDESGSCWCGKMVKGKADERTN